MANQYIYNPIPPRVWSRVENPCVYNYPNFNINNLIYSSLTKTFLPPSDAAYEQQLLTKGNILQYKNNNANLTKKQRYSKIAKGQWVGKISYATQSETYTNPNTTGLQRVNYVEIPPNNIVGSPNNPSGPFQVSLFNPLFCPTDTVTDGGNLVCNNYVNQCTGEIIKNTQSTLCFPTYCSDVPGEPIFLCWNNGIQTWYPRKRYTMTNSANKWPVNYKGFVSAIKPNSPTLTGVLNADSTVTLNWSLITSVCTPISNWTVFKDNALIENIAFPTSSTIIYNLEQGQTYSFYVVAVNNDMISPPSNIYTVTIPTNTN